MHKVPDAYKPRPVLLKWCVIALLGFWLITLAKTQLSSDGQLAEERRNQQAMNVIFPGLAALIAIAWFARVREIRRRGELVLWIERESWRRGEEITGSVGLGFVDPVVDADIRIVERHGAGSYFGDPFTWKRVEDPALGRQVLSFRGTVGMDARDSSLYVLEVRTRTISGMNTLSGFSLGVHGERSTEI